jgi:REP element-mobilizing transposase RayT
MLDERCWASCVSPTYSGLLTRHITALRDALGEVRRRHPFAIHGWVVLPEHTCTA